MSGNQWDDDDDEGQVSDTDLLRQLRKQLKEAQKRDSEREAELAKFRTDSRTRSLSEVLSQKGLNSKVAKLYPGDAEATPEAVDAWLTEYGEVFGLTAAPATQESELSTADVNLHQRIAQSGQQSGNPTRESDAAARIAAAKSPEELIAFLSSGH